MRGLTVLERNVLESASLGHEFQWEEGGEGDDEMYAAHDEMTRLGWLHAEDDDEATTWTTTARGRRALELDALVRGSS